MGEIVAPDDVVDADLVTPRDLVSAHLGAEEAVPVEVEAGFLG